MIQHLCTCGRLWFFLKVKFYKIIIKIPSVHFISFNKFSKLSYIISHRVCNLRLMQFFNKSSIQSHIHILNTVMVNNVNYVANLLCVQYT